MSSEDSVPRIIPVVYEGPNKYGDFSAMIRNKNFDDSLFIFNDNVRDNHTARTGGGNAAIRPYNEYGTRAKYPRSAGIPTGYSRYSGGFRALTPEVQAIIDAEFEAIKRLIFEHEYRRVYFSAEPAVGHRRPQIGTSIFNVDPQVKAYITKGIYDLGDYSQE